MRFSTLITGLLAIQILFAVSAFSQDFDFFYFVQQWPGSYCDTKHGCCYPTSGKPAADFGIHGLWPNNQDGSYPSDCEPIPFDQSQVSDLVWKLQKEWPTLSCPKNNCTKFWAHEWEKHGTCSLRVLDQHDYFITALHLKKQLNLLQVLKTAGIEPNGQTYTLESIKGAIKKGVGFTPFVECNVDQDKNTQLYQIYLCVDKMAYNLIECPIFPHGKCGSHIEFPSF